MIIIDQEKAVAKINEINPNYILLSEFKGWRENIKRQCKVCGDIREVKARSLIEKNHGQLRKCPVCAAIERAKSYRKTHEQFMTELHEINNNIEVLDNYITNSDKLRCRCIVDRFEWEASPHSLLEGHGCPECANKLQNRRNNEQFLEELKLKHPTITPLGQLKRVNDSMKFHCDVCNYEWETTPNVLLNKEMYYGCPKCNGFAPVSELEMIERLKIKNPNIEYISGYSGIIKHAKFKCLSCNHEWETPVNSVLSGRGCPKCNRSHGELEIEKVLNNIGAEYKAEHRFNDCKDERTLPFDFYIESSNTCIEYDGEQHFKPVRFNKNMTDEQAKNKFESTQHRDRIKTNYCKDKGIKLIRIPYTEFNNIEQILNKLIS